MRNSKILGRIQIPSVGILLNVGWECRVREGKRKSPHNNQRRTLSLTAVGADRDQTQKNATF